MTGNEGSIRIGFVLTKAPLESGLVETALRTAAAARGRGDAVGFFLLSDGIWLAKKGARNTAADLFARLIAGGARAMASRDHLLAAGIAEGDVMEGVEVTNKPYPSLVEHVMELWDRVVVV